MFTRIAILVVVFSAMGAGGFTLGRSSASSGQAGGLGVPQDQPVVIALENRSELKLSAAQSARLEDIKLSLEKKLEPFQRRAKELENKVRELQQSGGTPEARARLEEEMKALQQTLESQVPTIIAKATEDVLQTLNQEQREALQRLMQTRMGKSGADNLVLTFIMEKREQLGLSPQQFTKLQYLQSDLIRAFAPVREQIEMLQIEMRRGVEQTHKEPGAQLIQRMRSLEEQVAVMKEKFSNRAIEEVLSAEQRQKLQSLLHGNGKT
jgi:Skp family chaperone for outer membrane proteins/quinol monooxygenase YgiN